AQCDAVDPGAPIMAGDRAREAVRTSVRARTDREALVRIPVNLGRACRLRQRHARGVNKAPVALTTEVFPRLAACASGSRRRSTAPHSMPTALTRALWPFAFAQRPRDARRRQVEVPA